MVALMSFQAWDNDMVTRQCPEDKPLSCVAVATPCRRRGGRQGCATRLLPRDCTEMLSSATHVSAPLLLTIVPWAMPPLGRQIHGRGVIFGAQRAIPAKPQCS